AGARLVLSARSAGTLEDVVSLLRERGADVLGVAGDVGHDADAARMARAAEEAYGHVDVLVNNAGVLLEPRPMTATPAGDWEETLRVNVVGTANLIRHVLPGMEARGEGVIINLSSTWGRTAAPHVAPYCASKWAVEGLTRSLAGETGPGIVTFALNPGVIATEMLATAFGGDVSAYPDPDSLGGAWARLFGGLGPSWHGTSRDLT
ncbi:MAG: SDR family oxidoreductase, partial [Planctomycetota bacterium]|nr:SDR family oxidoreductase [Planctomycetota bacterium]